MKDEAKEIAEYLYFSGNFEIDKKDFDCIATRVLGRDEQWKI